MSKFNTNVAVKTRTTNLAGGDAFKQTTELELVSILLTSFVEDQFYRTSEDTLNRLRDIFAGLKDKSFAAKASVYARNEWGMRSITHVVAVEIANKAKGESWTAQYITDVVRRVDDMTEIMSLYLNTYGKPVPNSLKRGLAKAFEKFDEYQLAKYRAGRKDVSLVDVVNLVRPKPVEKNRAALKKLVDGTLRSFNTWESELSTSENEADKKASWKKLILERKIGYFALLRNLRNIALQAPEYLTDACNLLQDEKLIKKSLVLPFRFQTAYDTLMDSEITQAQMNELTVAISNAMEISLENVPSFEGRTLVVLDDSGSMEGRPGDIGSLFAATILKKNPSADFVMFSSNARTYKINVADSLVSITNAIRGSFRAGGTNLAAVFQLIRKSYDRIIILSDMQTWIETYYESRSPVKEYEAWKTKTGADPYVFAWDLTGYGSMQFPERNVCALAGFSEKSFDIIKLLETDKRALVNTIKNYG